MNNAALESKTVAQILQTAMQAPKYKTKQGDRYSARLAIKPEGSSAGWYEQDTNMLFKTGRYLFNIPVQGTSAEYNVTIEIPDFLPLFKKIVHTEPFNVPTFQKALTQALSTLPIKVSCQCPDFVYRGQYAATINDTNAGRPQSQPATQTNPTGQEIYCKHIVFCLSNKVWAPRIARNLFNYVFNLWKSNRLLFDRIVRPALDLTDEQIENRPIKPRYATRQPQTPDPIKQSAMPVLDGATEAVNSYYAGSQTYDDDQQFMLDTARDNGTDISLLVTPENTPDQMYELAIALGNGLDNSSLAQLADATLPPSSIAIIAKALLKNIDLLKYKNFAPDVLAQLLRAAKYNVPLSAVALTGYNAKQIEQLTSAYLKSKDLYQELLDNKLNYQQMRDKIQLYK